MIRVAICDFDMRHRKHIKDVCEKCLEDLNVEYQMKQYSSGEEMLSEEYPEMLILGVKLKRISGIGLKEILEHMNAETRIVFVAENRNHMAEAFGRNVYGFLNYPIKEKAFYEIVERMVRDIQYQTQKIFCYQDGTGHTIYFKDIVYIEVAGRKTKVFVKKDKNQVHEFLVDKTLKNWEEVLPKDVFVKGNRRQLINLKYVVDINRQVTLINHITISIGNVYRNQMRERMNEYQSRRKRVYGNSTTSNK